jgi:ATP-dependent protease HslVU (ClpYQ) peptidase subunit
MTTILGVETNDGFTISADLQTSSGDRPFIHRDIRKITTYGQYVVTGAGVSRYVDVVLFARTLPIYNSGDLDNMYEFVVTKVIPEIKRLHDECGYNLKEDESFEFLIGLAGQLYYIAEDYSVIRTDSGVYGLGTGGKIALGCYLAGNLTVREAVHIAIKQDINSGGPVQSVSRKKP